MNFSNNESQKNPIPKIELDLSETGSIQYSTAKLSCLRRCKGKIHITLDYLVGRYRSTVNCRLVVWTTHTHRKLHSSEP